MAASKRSRRAQAPIKILSCVALFVASFVVYWMGISAYEQRLRPSTTEGADDRMHRTSDSESRSIPDDTYATPEPTLIEKFSELVHRAFPSSPRSTLDSYATPGSAYIEHPAVQCKAVPCGTSYALDGTSPPLATLDSYATPGFRGIVEEGKRAGEITKAKKEATQSQAAPQTVREASPKAISPPDADLTLADASGADPSDLSVPASQRPAYQGPAVRVPASKDLPSQYLPSMDLLSQYLPSKDLPSSDAVDSGVFCCGSWGYFRQKRQAGFVSLRRKQYEPGALGSLCWANLGHCRVGEATRVCAVPTGLGFISHLTQGFRPGLSCFVPQGGTGALVSRTLSKSTSSGQTKSPPWPKEG
jgi:hypothetical protein